MKPQIQIFAIAGVVFLLWHTPVMVPLKILIVFFHELSHGLAAILTGGRIESISISPQQGGLAVTSGGIRFIIISAGYLGSLGIGVLLFRAAQKSRADQIIMGLLGGVLIVVAVLYMREVFALGFTLLIGGAMLASARFLSDTLNDIFLRIIGLVSMGYVPFDIISDTILRSDQRSDAYALSQQVGLPTIFWGGLWLLLGSIIIFRTLKTSWRETVR